MQSMFEIPVSIPEYVIIGDEVDWKKIIPMKMKDQETAVRWVAYGVSYGCTYLYSSAYYKKFINELSFKPKCFNSCLSFA